MCPIYLTLAAPVCKVFRVPLVLWFAHPRDSISLAIADRLADRVLTSLPLSYPRPSRKLSVLGQGIDVRGFLLPPPPESRNALWLLAVGRTSPSKGFGTILSAVAELHARGVPAFLRIVGPSTTELELRERTRLQSLISELGLSNAVTVEAAVPHDTIGQHLREADVLVNATVPGSGDKIVFEAMASGRVVVASNPAFGPLLGDSPLSLMYSPGDSSDLASKLQMIAQHDSNVRAQIGETLRQRVTRGHAVETWAERVVGVVTSLREDSS
jgi:glycosyltransferase involved in cell wall biosynthesis